MKRKSKVQFFLKSALVTIICSCIIATPFSAVSTNQYNTSETSSLGNLLLGTTIYVDDDAEPGGDGSLEHPFQTIWEGLDAANEDDTVFVFNGTYDMYCWALNRPIILDKYGVKLIGENKTHTIIKVWGSVMSDGSAYPAITITADKVTLSSFTIQTTDTAHIADGWPAITKTNSDGPPSAIMICI